MKQIKILGINVLDRIKEANRTQQVLSNFSSIIETRLGFHELNAEVSSRKAFMLIKLKGNPDEWDKLESRLNEIGGIEVKTMNFTV
jgi:uncharacterized protein with ATP-grasp and redox domains